MNFSVGLLLSPSHTLVKYQLLPSMVPILSSQRAKYAPSFPEWCLLFLFHKASDVTCPDLGQLGIPQCISTQPTTAAPMAESVYFKV